MAEQTKSPDSDPKNTGSERVLDVTEQVGPISGPPSTGGLPGVPRSQPKGWKEGR